MIKFTCDGRLPGTTVVGLGLTRRNCERLLAGDPIMVDIRGLALPYPVIVALFAGEDELRMGADLQRQGFELPTDPAKIHIDPRIAEA